jgi:hypothetical protein
VAPEEGLIQTKFMFCSSIGTTRKNFNENFREEKPKPDGTRRR